MLLPISKILCPTDFSDASYEALKAAVELAENFGAQLILVHVVPAMPQPIWADPLCEDREAYEPGLSEYEEALRISAQQNLHSVIKQHLPATIESRVIVVEGEAARAIVQIAEDESVSLIVIATHGLTGWRQVAFGSVADRVVHTTCRPFLAIRGSGEKQ